MGRKQRHRAKKSRLGSESWREMARRFCFTINDKKFYAVLDENSVTNQLVSLCPFETDMVRRGGHEYYTSLSQKLSVDGCKIISEIRKNQITYFDGWNALSFLFEDANISPYMVEYLGEFEDDVAAYLCNAGDTVHIQCELDCR